MEKKSLVTFGGENKRCRFGFLFSAPYLLLLSGTTSGIFFFLFEMKGLAWKIAFFLFRVGNNVFRKYFRFFLHEFEPPAYLKEFLPTKLLKTQKLYGQLLSTHLFSPISLFTLSRIRRSFRTEFASLDNPTEKRNAALTGFIATF